MTRQIIVASTLDRSRRRSARSDPMKRTPPAPPEEITTRQALEILGFTNPSTITRYVENGKLRPARKLPGATGAFLFYRSDVEALAAQRAAASPAGQP